MKHTGVVIIGGILIWLIFLPRPVSAASHVPRWEVQSIDTMKYSRDLAREKLTDNSFDDIITSQVNLIAQTGATHVAIGTPYDEEFLPFLRRWVDSARNNQLKVWFRGNFAGWENWFGYSDISREDHLKKTVDFILKNPRLFSDGDIFTPCPECENGGPGDPRRTGDVVAYRQFLVDLYQTCLRAFSQINKSVSCNYFSTNGDVASLIMDRDTTQKLGGIVVIDHYVSTPEKLERDIKNLAAKSGGQIVLGEFGVPIPDIHGLITAESQSVWLADALFRLSKIPQVVGLNYWTSFGSSSAIWDDSGTQRPAVKVLTTAYTPPVVNLSVKNAAGRPLNTAVANLNSRTFTPGKSGQISIPVLTPNWVVTISAPGYQDHGLQISQNYQSLDIVLEKNRETWLFKLQVLTYRILRRILP